MFEIDRTYLFKVNGSIYTGRVIEESEQLVSIIDKYDKSVIINKQDIEIANEK